MSWNLNSRFDFRLVPIEDWFICYLIIFNRFLIQILFCLQHFVAVESGGGVDVVSVSNSFYSDWIPIYRELVFSSFRLIRAQPLTSTNILSRKLLLSKYS